jgi:coenzyme PQQ synthesis protein D (PqqD)
LNPLAPAPHVRHVSTADGTVLLDIDRGRFYGLNPTATVVWKGLSDGQSVEQITGDLAARFTAPTDQIRADVTALVAQLRDRGVLDTGGRPT